MPWDLTQRFFVECWAVLREAAPFMLLGFFVAGLIKGLLPDAWMTKHLAGRGPLSVFKAALVGVPLPLCSCGVLPAALGLRRKGAGPGATTAFMISTPETGVDSIAVTYAMIDPIMTVLRPLAALGTAIVAGLAANLLPGRLVHAAAQSPAPSCGCSCGGACCGDDHHAPDTGASRLRDGLADAFGEMLADVGVWLLIGVVVAGVIGVLLPPGILAKIPGGELGSMLVMLAAGVPLYVCASSSTPVAASLLLKGLSPGAALVFLLTGPATNVTTLTVMARSFGVALTGVYVAAIAACSVVFGLIANRVYTALGVNIHAAIGHVDEALPANLETACAVLLLLLIARALLAERSRRRAAACPAD